tara:strand:- start:7173 stop:7460 length:288 start_codon:yes stop_codon:yes gene_type:complete
MNVAEEFLALIEDAVAETGTDLAETKELVAGYMAERATHLSTIAHEPGFGQAVIAERNNVAMRAGLAISADAAAVDNRWIGMIGGALRIAAIALI